MENKFSSYDLFGYLLPGAVVVLLAIYYAKTLGYDLTDFFGHEALAATTFLVASFIAGHFMQATSSGWVERSFYWLSLGKPSYILTTRGLSGMNHERWLRAKASILKGLGYAKTDEEVAAYPDDEVIKLAFQSSRKLGETERFNGLYALNRALLSSLLLALVFIGLATWRNWQVAPNIWPLVVTLFLFVLQIARYRQRGELLVLEAVRQSELRANLRRKRTVDAIEH